MTGDQKSSGMSKDRSPPYLVLRKGLREDVLPWTGKIFLPFGLFRAERS
jgi:hypothetical protein